MSTKFNASFDNVVSTMYISSFRYWIAVYNNESAIYLSVLNHMDQVASTVAEKGLNFKLREGFSAETSGNILPCVYTPVSLMFRRLTKVYVRRCIAA